MRISDWSSDVCSSDLKKGPKQGAPAQAVDGFMKANGLAALDEAELRETDKGAFYFVVRRIAGRPTAEVLPGLLAKAVTELPWPKSMRWASEIGRASCRESGCK